MDVPDIWYVTVVKKGDSYDGQKGCGSFDQQKQLWFLDFEDGGKGEYKSYEVKDKRTRPFPYHIKR